MVKMARPYREAFFEAFDGSTKKLEKFIEIGESSLNKDFKKTLPFAKNIYCERVKSNKVIADVDINIGYKYEIWIMVDIKDKETGEMITYLRIEDNDKYNPIFFIKGDSKTYTVNPNALAANIYDNHYDDCKYHSCIYEAINKYGEFSFMHDIIQLAQNKKYMEMIK